MNSRFVHETRDDPWALDMEEGLRALWPGIDTGVEPGLYIGCTQTLCQVNIQTVAGPGEDAAYGRLVQHRVAVLGSSLGEQLQFYSYTVANRQELKIYAYVFRRIGHTPPDEPEVCRR